MCMYEGRTVGWETYTEHYEVDHHDYECDNPCKQGDQDADDAAEEATEGKDRSNECQATGDWVQDERIGEAIRAIRAGAIEACPINLAHDVCDIVTDCLRTAVVLICCDWGHIERTMSKCSKRERAMSNIGLVREHNFHNADVADNRR